MTYDFNTSLLSGDAIWPPRAKLRLSKLTEAETSSPVRYIPGRLVQPSFDVSTAFHLNAVQRADHHYRKSERPMDLIIDRVSSAQFIEHDGLRRDPRANDEQTLARR